MQKYCKMFLQKELDDSLGKRKKATDEDVNSLQKYTSQAQELRDSLKLHQELLPQISAAENAKSSIRGSSRSSDSLVQVGNFLGPPAARSKAWQKKRTRLLVNN